MKKYDILKRVLLKGVFVTALFVGTNATAAMISYSAELNTGSSIRGNNPVSNFSAAIPFFDPNLGTLRQVDIVYNLDLQLGINISNRTLNPAPFTLANNQFRVEGPRFFDRFNF